MTWKHALLASVCGCLFFTLTACQPVQDDSQSDFYVAWSGRAGKGEGYSPQGWGWKPGSKVEISIFNEPNGPGSASTEWKHILDVVVDQSGMFGFSGPSPPFYPVNRNICGSPEQDQKMVFLAKNLNTGRFRMFRVTVVLYFTFQACGN
jgi:hypothetical protein